MPNFDALPNEKPVTVIPKGRYFATIEDATMKTPSDTTRPDYLNLKYALKDQTGKSVGIMFDIIAESDKPTMQYKLKRFLDACGLKFTGNFELRDVAKVVKGKEFIIDTTIDEQEGRQPRAVADVFTGEIYYPIAEAKDLFEGVTEDIISASDAEDVENF